MDSRMPTRAPVGDPGWAEAWVSMPGPSQPLPAATLLAGLQEDLQTDPSPVPNLEGHLYQKRAGSSII